MTSALPDGSHTQQDHTVLSHFNPWGIDPLGVISRPFGKEIPHIGKEIPHNHPSGVAEPTAADRAITRRLQDALSLIDVWVLDHVVVSAGDAMSFAERGLL